MSGATVRVGVGLGLWLALLVGLPELIPWVILVGSRLRGLEWRALLKDELALILLAGRWPLISWRLRVRGRLLEPCMSDLIPCVKFPEWRTG